MRSVHLKLTKQEFVALYTLMMHVTLGNRNPSESAFSDLMVELETGGAEVLLQECKVMGMHFPRVQFVANDLDQGIELI